MGRYFGTDGIRGTANKTVTCDMALRLGAAAGRLLAGCGGNPGCVIGADTRSSSDMLMLSVAAGLCSAGVDALMVGVIPTPAVAYLTAKWGCAAGIMISASHNPPEYNGIKLFSAAGMKLPDEIEACIEELMDAPPVSAPPSHVGHVRHMRETALREYSDHLRSAADMRLDGLQIAVDCANGAAAATAGELLRSLGATTHMLNCDISGLRINEGCGSTHMEELCAYVRDRRLDVGVAFDGDADRCLCADENGNIVDGDVLLSIFAQNMLDRGLPRGKTVVGTVMSNLGLTKFCRERGLDFIPAQVGDRYVLENLIQCGGSLGGEQSGHIIFPDIASTGDGQLTAIRLMCVMRQEGLPLSMLAARMRRYPQHTENIKVTEAGRAAFHTHPEAKRIVDAARDALGDDGRLLVRLSGTEPLVRVMAEGPDDEHVRSVVRGLSDNLQKILP